MYNKSPILTIIIPARNEESTIIKTLERLIKQVKVPCQYIVVSDQSTDQTVSKVKKCIRKHPNVALLETTLYENGFANAIKKGFEKTRSKYVIPVMADLCDDPRTINIMYQKILEGYDIVVGSRYISGGGKSGGPKLQGVLSKAVCLSLHLLTSIPTHDISNSFKLYRKSILTNLKINKSFGVEISMDLILQAYFKGARITEMPTHWFGRTEGQSKFKIFQRFPRYLNIYLWALKERLKQLLKGR